MGPGCRVRWSVDYHLGVVAHELMGPTFFGVEHVTCLLWGCCVYGPVNGRCVEMCLWVVVVGVPKEVCLGHLASKNQLLGWRLGRLLSGPPLCPVPISSTGQAWVNSVSRKEP